MESASLDIVIVDERFRPQDAEDAVKRALFFCHGIYAYSAKQIRVFVKRCRDGELGAEVENALADGLADWRMAEATKELAAITIHQTGMDQGADTAPEWLIEFLIESLRECDLLFPEPSTEWVITTYGEYSQRQIIIDVSKHICNVLTVPREDQALTSLQEQLAAIRPYRNELLLFALTQPPETLRRHLETAY